MVIGGEAVTDKCGHGECLGWPSGRNGNVGRYSSGIRVAAGGGRRGGSHSESGPTQLEVPVAGDPPLTLVGFSASEG